MFVNTIDPVLLDMGFLKIHYYGLFYIIGFVLLYLAYRHAAVKGYIENLDKRGAEDLLFYVMIGVIVGARLFFFIFYEPKALFSDPFEFFKVWHGGMSFHGGLIGALTAMLIFTRKNKIRFLPILNMTAVVAIFSLALGRLGNFINSELVGTASNLPWCVVFKAYDDVCRHPYVLYAMLSHLLLFGYLLFLLYRKDIAGYLKTRWLTANFLIGYGILRMLTDIWKVDNVFWILKTGQWLSLAMIAAGILVAIYPLLRKN